jgi:hypothetical protein
MAEPNLEQMLQAAEQRKAMPQNGIMDLLTRLFFGQQPNATQMPRYDEKGNPLPAQNMPGLLRK